MFTDNQNQFSGAQALTGTAVSTNVIDLSQDRDVGIGEALAISLTVDVGAVGGGTLQITLQTDSSVGFGSAVTVAQTAAIAAASLTAGSKVYLNVPPDLVANRFLRLNYTLVTMTNITVTANLVPLNFIQADSYAASSFTVK